MNFSGGTYPSALYRLLIISVCCFRACAPHFNFIWLSLRGVCYSDAKYSTEMKACTALPN